MMYIWAKNGHLFFVAMTVLLFNLRYWMRFAKPENRCRRCSKCCRT